MNRQTSDNKSEKATQAFEKKFHHESYCRKCKEPMNPQTPDNEVARLRELLEWAETLLCNAEPPKHSDYAEWMGRVHKWRDQKHGLAPAPEEPTTEESSVTESKKWFPANPPLEKELRYIEHRGTSLPDTRSYIAQALRYLRAEIQKLKEAR